MTLLKVQDSDYYTFSDGNLRYTYHPLTGIVKGGNLLSSYMAIEYFASRGFIINWFKSRVAYNTLCVELPEYLTDEEGLAILSTTKEDLYAQSLSDRAYTRSKLILNNIDNTTGEVIKENYLIDTMRRQKRQEYNSREHLIGWYNRYNLEVARPLAPLIIISTKNKQTIINEGKRLIWGLFEQGLLRKLTKDEYEDKVNKYKG